jgi:DNA-binding MarR family transcriptional regulator
MKPVEAAIGPIETSSISAIRDFRRSFRDLEREMSFYIGAQADCCGLGLAQCHLLLEVEARGPESIGYFASRLDLDASTVSRSADSLVKTGLLCRHDDPSNRRRQIISLSCEGRTRAAEINRLCDSWYRQVLGSIGDGDRTALSTLLPALAEAMRRFRDAAGSCCARGQSEGDERNTEL